jgi:hypothetical protein
VEETIGNPQKSIMVMDYAETPSFDQQDVKSIGVRHFGKHASKHGTSSINSRDFRKKDFSKFPGDKHGEPNLMRKLEESIAKIPLEVHLEKVNEAITAIHAHLWTTRSNKIKVFSHQPIMGMEQTSNPHQ